MKKIAILLGAHIYAYATNEYHQCICGATANHSGGNATCTAMAVCEICLEGYGKTLGHMRLLNTA